jgi:hypothetical protein
MRVASRARPRVLALSAQGRTARRLLPADALVPAGIDLVLPPSSTTPVTLDARPGAATVPGDGRPLMVRVQDLRVTPSG